MKSTRVVFLDGFEHTISNSKNLLKIAVSACRQKEFGIASALNILAAEEAIKAFILLFRHYFPTIEPPDFNDFFTKHKTKHSSLIWFCLCYIVFMKHAVSVYKKDPKTFDEIFAAPSSKLERDVAKAMKLALDSQKSELSFDEIKNWLENANNQKNNGFYVDIVNNVWITPKDITKNKFEKEKVYTQTIQKYIQMIAADLKDEHFLAELRNKFHALYKPSHKEAVKQTVSKSTN